MSLGNRDRAALEARFRSCVDCVTTPGGCWLWTGRTDSDGYGYFHLGGHRRAHRVALEIALGRELAPGEQALHECDTPGCCRVGPGHIHVGTVLDNVRERVERGRTARGSAHYKARLSEADVMEIRRLGAALGRGRTAVLAERFGVGQRCISHILRGDNWSLSPTSSARAA